MDFSATAILNREDFGMMWNNYFGRELFMAGKHIELNLDAEADLVWKPERGRRARHPARAACSYMRPDATPTIFLPAAKANTERRFSRRNNG